MDFPGMFYSTAVSVYCAISSCARFTISYIILYANSNCCLYMFE